MADIFIKSDVEKLLGKKTVWFFGDSNMRGMYKDLLWLLEKNTLIELSSLRGKLEGTFMYDRLVKGGALHRGRNFQEIRHYKNFKLDINIEFTFLTKCNSEDIETRLKYAEQRKEVPDVVVLNSCLWDITRWGPESVAKYKLNIVDLVQKLKKSLPSQTKVIWVTTPPISHEPHGGFFIKQIEFLKHTLRFDVMEANFFVSREFALQGFDVLDIHHHLLLQIHRRRPDGIHWSPEAMRHITNLFLTHLCISWNLPLPGNFKTPLLDQGRLQGCCGLFSFNSNVSQMKNLMKTSSDSNSLSDSSKGTLPLMEPFSNALKSLFPGNKQKRKGKKRDRNGNFLCQNSSKVDFTKDSFSYDHKKKKFRIRGRRNRRFDYILKLNLTSSVGAPLY